MNHSTPTSAKPAIYSRCGVLTGTLDQYPARPEHCWQLACGQKSVTCLIPDPDLLHGLLSRPLTCYRLHLAGWPPEKHGTITIPVLLGIQQKPDEDPLAHLPPDTCPLPGVLPGTLTLLRQIETPPLQRFVRDIFRDREVCSRYWTLPSPGCGGRPGSRPGGLAGDSLELARKLAGESASPHERDLGIATGLLHNIGWIWALGVGMKPTAAGYAMHHSMIALARLAAPLRALEMHWPDGAYAMHTLLGRHRLARHRGMYPDQILAALEEADCHEEPGFPPWTPTPWHQQASAPR